MSKQASGEAYNDKLERQIDLNAPLKRVWDAITDYKQFGEWFRVDIKMPFEVGQKSSGFILHPGYEHVQLEVNVIAIEPMRRFAYTWHPYAIDPNIDYSTEPPTTVEFLFTEIGQGTRLVITESGFDAIPIERRSEAFRMNGGGWSAQMKNIEKYINNGS